MFFLTDSNLFCIVAIRKKGFTFGLFSLCRLKIPGAHCVQELQLALGYVVFFPFRWPFSCQRYLASTILYLPGLFSPIPFFQPSSMLFSRQASCLDCCSFGFVFFMVFEKQNEAYTGKVELVHYINQGYRFLVD